jgi:1,2-diacylglycerol 3-alpha-glucosyltransferase
VSYLFFSDTHSSRPDGVAKSVAWSAEALRKLGKDVVLVRPWYDESLPDQYEVPLRSFRFPGRDYYVSWSSYLRSATYWSSRSGIDMSQVEAIHVHSLGPIGMLGLRYAWARSIPVVLTWHTDLISYAKIYPEIYFGAAAILPQLFVCSPNRRRLSLNWSVPGAISNILRSVDGIVAPSKKTAVELSLLCPEANISVIPTGLPEYFYRRELTSGVSVRLRYDVANDDQLVLFVGRLSAEKNPGLLISVLRALHSIYPEAKAVVVGDPGHGRQGRRWQRELENSGAVLTSSMPHPNLMTLYDAADLLLVTSLTETQGLTVLEAHASGLPVVCADPALAFFGDIAIPDVWVAETASPNDIIRMTVRILRARQRPTTWPHVRPLAHRDSSLSSNVQALRLIDLYDKVVSRTQIASFEQTPR